MAIKDFSNLEAARTAARLAFDDALDGLAPSAIEGLAETYSTGAEIDQHAFMVSMGSMRKWLGEKVYNNFQSYAQNVRLDRYEETYDLPRLTVDRDHSGVVARGLANWVRNTLQSANEQIIFDTLISASGDGPTAFDGQALFSTSHVLGDQSYSNKTTSALSPTTYDSAVQAMMSYKAASGQPLNIFPTAIIVGPKLRKTAFDIAGNPERVAAVDDSGAESGTRVAAAAISNFYRGDNLDVIVSQRLTGTQDDYWYLADLSKQSKPLLLKSEREFELIELTDMTDQPRFDNDLYVWSIEADKTVAAGVPALIYGGIL